MKLIIEIPDFVYALAEKTNIIRANIEGLEKAIIDGKPIPKGHGRLIDADALLAQFRDGTEGYDCATYTRYEIGNIIDLEETIIEAESEAEHGKEIQ